MADELRGDDDFACRALKDVALFWMVQLNELQMRVASRRAQAERDERDEWPTPSEPTR